MYLLLAAAEETLTVGDALRNVVVGLLVVFVVLLFLCGIISMFKRMGGPDKADKKAEKVPVRTAPPAEEVKADTVGGEDNAVVAVILAAVAETCGPGARVTSIRKAES